MTCILSKKLHELSLHELEIKFSGNEYNIKQISVTNQWKNQWKHFFKYLNDELYSSVIIQYHCAELSKMTFCNSRKSYYYSLILHY